MIVARRGDGPWFFIEGYAKNKVENLEPEAFRVIQRYAVALMAMSASEREGAAARGNLKEVNCDAKAKVGADHAAVERGP